jgi:hypothetical protein
MPFTRTEVVVPDFFSALPQQQPRDRLRVEFFPSSAYDDCAQSHTLLL